MYVWTIELEEHWSHNEKGEYEDNGRELVIAASDADTATAKAKSICIGEKEDIDGKTYKLLDVRVLSIQRGVYVDAVTNGDK